MKNIGNRHKPKHHIAKHTGTGKNKAPLSVDKARSYFRKKDHPESPVLFWKKPKPKG